METPRQSPAIFRWLKPTKRKPQQILLTRSISLNFDMQPQQETNWCWAAVASSVSFYIDPATGKSQHQIALEAFEVEDEGDLSPDEWNSVFEVDKALAIVRCWRGTRSGEPLFGEIFSELDAQMPLVVRIGWPDNRGHGIVVCGCSVDDMGVEFLDIADPAYGDQLLPRADVQKYQGVGRWTHTYMITDYYASIEQSDT